MAYSTTAIVKSFLGVPASSTAEDVAISAALDAATSRIDSYCDRTFGTGVTAEARQFAPYSSSCVYVDDIGSTTDLVVKVDTDRDGTFATTLAASEFTLSPANSFPKRAVYRVGGHFLLRVDARLPIEVTARWTYDDAAVPDDVAMACTILAARYFQRKSAPLGLAAGLGGDFGPVRISTVDPDVRDLLSGYRLLSVG